MLDVGLIGQNQGNDAWCLEKLGLPDSVVAKQPFPGPGNAIRIIGAVTQDRLVRQRQADKIVLEELKKTGWLAKVFQSFPVMTGIKSTAVKGDSRFSH